MNCRISIVAALVGLSLVASAQDSIAWKRKWYVPDHAKIQFAGSMGMVSGGVGYDLFQHRADLDIYTGFLPERYSSNELFVFTLKYTHYLIKPVHVYGKWHVAPLTSGMYFTYTKGEKFSTKLPSQYPTGYYWWSETIRPNIFIGGSIIYTGLPKPMSLYYELGTNELKAVSYGLNASYLSFWDILHLGLGLKISL